MANTIINGYEVVYSANAFPPKIWLISSNTFFAQLVFHPDGSTLPPDAVVGGRIQVNYHLEDFQNCLALLQHEKTIYLSYNGSGPGFENSLMTSPEPPGS